MAADGQRHVVAIGGLGGTADPGRSFRSYLSFLSQLAGAARPRIALLTTATGDDPGTVARVREWAAGLPIQLEHLALFPMPSVADPADFLLSQDVIFVGGGSVANMVAVWRVHGIDAVMHTAWQAGVVLAGVSAGAICWFESGTTDSFGVELRAFTGGLGMLGGSYCPHYDSEPRRQPVYTALVGAGDLAPGVACDDGAAAHYTGTALTGIVSIRASARGYLVQPDGAGTAIQQPLQPRLLGDD